jgi:N-acetylglucosamine kinase-like BadF-type ATPase
MSYVLGIDGGGTKTVCIIMNAQREVLGRGEAGASNYQSIGVNAAFKSIESAIYAAAIEALKVIDCIQIKAICLGLAGVGRPRDIEIVESIVRNLENSHTLPIEWNLSSQSSISATKKNIIICHDALIALIGGIGHEVGIVVAAGTGSIVFGRNQQGITKRVGGWGHILGDEGSGYQIAVAGLQAAMQAYDGRGKSTILQEVFQNHLALETIEDLVEVVYRRGWGVKEIAALAVVVNTAATQGDEVANRIINDAVRELVKATSTVINTLALSNPSTVNDSFEVVIVGSVWGRKSNASYREGNTQSKIVSQFTKSITYDYPSARIIYPRFEPAYGAGLLALKPTIYNR